jgi:DNA-binding HxlR family transcriptional regulator
MILNDFSDIFQSKLRLMIISALITGQKTFKEIKEITGATAGNIRVQTTNLEKAGYIIVSKTYNGRKPQTTLSITEEGKKAFIEYVNMLNTLINSALHSSNENKD